MKRHLLLWGWPALLTALGGRAISQTEDAYTESYTMSETAWRKPALEKWCIQRPMQSFRPVGGTASYFDVNFAGNGPARIHKVSSRPIGPDGVEFYARVFFSDRPTPWLEHQMLTFYRGTLPDLVETRGGWILQESQDGFLISWRSNERLIVAIATGGIYPTAVVDTYLERYPSMLAPSYNPDRVAWGKAEIDDFVFRIGTALDSHGPPSLAGGLFTDFDFYFGGENFAKRFGEDQSVENGRRLLEEIREWRRRAETQLKWDPEPRGGNGGSRYHVYSLDKGLSPAPFIRERKPLAGQRLPWIAAGAAAAVLVLAALWIGRKRRKVQGIKLDVEEKVGR